MKSINFKDILTKTAVLTTFFICLILPLKFGSLANIPEQPLIYPSNFIEMILLVWPVPYFPFLAAVAFLLSLSVSFTSAGTARKVFFISIAALAFTSLFGFLRASVYDYALIQTSHIFSLSLFGFAAGIILSSRNEYKQAFQAAIFAGAICSLISGYYQYFAGFEEVRQFAAQQELYSGAKFVSGNFATRLYESRVSASFTLCNNFAGYLVLVFPLCLWLVWDFCKRVDPPKLARMIFIPLVSIAFLFILYQTGSRAAMLSLIAGSGISFLILPFNRKLRLLALSGSVATIIAGALAVYLSHRGFLSMSVRIDYFEAAIKMFLANPLTGTGWGDFFHEYMKIKHFMTDEAPRTPHNIVLAFASQCGIAGLLAILLFLATPLIAGVSAIHRSFTRDGKVDFLKTSLLVGLIGWTLHSLSDVNLQVPASVCIFIMMSFILFDIPETKAPERNFRIILTAVGIAMLIYSLFAGMKVLSRELAFYELQNLCDPRFKTREDFARLSEEEVLRVLKNAVTVAPESPFPWATAADFMMSKGKFSSAEDFYLEASKRSPERPSFYFSLYRVQKLEGKYQDAAENLKKAIELFPNNPKYKNLQE